MEFYLLQGERYEGIMFPWRKKITFRGYPYNLRALERGADIPTVGNVVLQARHFFYAYVDGLVVAGFSPEEHIQHFRLLF